MDFFNQEPMKKLISFVSQDLSPYYTMRFKGYAESENATHSALDALKIDLIPTSQTRFGKESAKHLGMPPKVFHSDLKAKCNIGRIIFFPCTFHLRWA